jgi:hypothetical protein
MAQPYGSVGLENLRKPGKLSRIEYKPSDLLFTKVRKPTADMEDTSLESRNNPQAPGDRHQILK